MRTREELREAIANDVIGVSYQERLRTADRILALVDEWEQGQWRPAEEAEYYQEYLTETPVGLMEVAWRGETPDTWHRRDGWIFRAISFRELPTPPKEG